MPSMVLARFDLDTTRLERENLLRILDGERHP